MGLTQSPFGSITTEARSNPSSFPETQSGRRPVLSPGLPSPESTVNSSERKGSNEYSLSQIMHPSHEPTSQSSKVVDEDLPSGTNQGTSVGVAVKVYQACQNLGISIEVYQLLITQYFEKMTSFSLFRRPYFESKLQVISSEKQIEALLASMFSFSARFCTGTELQNMGGLGMNVPSTSYFHSLASRFIDEALEQCVEDTPPLCLLQAMILTTFQLLIEGVRGKAWRTLGGCIRMAYELELHCIDMHPNEAEDQSDITTWCLKEERRRAWWTLWEFDVFASTIRRLPTAIDWTQNSTWLPVDDEAWYGGKYRRSCVLIVDPAFRWKTLQQSGNTSAKAWFIVTNSLARNALLFSYPQSFSTQSSQQGISSKSATRKRPIPELPKESQMELDILENALRCVSMALPPRLAYQEQSLIFKEKGLMSMQSTRQEDADIYSIHLMIQLTRFMVYHYAVSSFQFGDAETGKPAQSVDNSSTESNNDRSSSSPNQNQGAWNRFLDASNEIITIIRNSSREHVHYVNPLLANTIYLAAAAQVVYRIINPSAVNRRKIDSNIDLLRLTFNSYVSFWNVSSTLQDKLNSLEARLEAIRARDSPSIKRRRGIRDVRQPEVPRATFSQDEGRTAAGSSALEQPEPIMRTGNSLLGVVPEAPWTFSQQDFTDCTLFTDGSLGYLGFDLDELLTYG
ncbi:hypothetical protein AOQ84DRAFT_154229 [Glonium stellatum]|uniref:Xylanolytic transcriptional activator regulatory domain-containing protein n=1 Tax=Glonium stellatum TaxID=574774 RepID=A0A8E2JNJ4_9PEZI|nr:hypothetical protein AOQ84DRAFT_154229 [Glonium stellatum]